MTTLLVMTAGRTDVQLVDQGKKCEFEKNQIGAVHDRLRENPGFWKLVDSPSERGGSVKQLPEGAVWEICTPKFDAALAYFGATPPSSVLILETTRKTPSDPHYAGGVLQIRANGKGISDVQRSAYLGPADRNVEDRDCPLDAIIRRDVVRRIEVAIRDAAKDAERVVVAITGGIPEIKALVKELVRLHAPAGVEPDEIDVDDGARSGQPDKAVSRRGVDPIEPVRLRKQALSLIEHGNLIGAWGAVQHLDPQAHPWTLVIDWLYCFASSLPIPAECDIEVLNHPRMAVRAGLRVELALRAGDIPRAVHGTAAFFEAAFWDWLRQRDLSKEDGVTGGNQTSGFTFDLPLNGEKKTRFKRQNRINDFDDGIEAWLPVLNKPALTALRDALSEDIRGLRNDIAHNEPTPKLMDEARTRMQTAKLWSSTDTFLSQPIVQAVLEELGEASPENLLTNLLVEVRRYLVTPTSICEVRP